MSKNITFLGTTIGSLPHENSQEAVELSFSVDIPVLPQLVNVSANEDMLAQPIERMPGVFYDEEDKRWYIDPESETFCEELEEFFMDYEAIIGEGDMDTLEKYAISEAHCSGMPFLLDKLKNLKPEFVKGQVTGPFTFGTALVDREKKCAFYDETLREITTKALAIKALWMVKKFKEAHPDVQPIIFMDEPTISQYGTSAFLTVKKEDIIFCFQEVSSVLKQAGALVGVHCCGKSDWSMITECGVDILNFDGYYFAESLGLYPTEIESFLKNGGIIAWGMVPTMDTDALDASTVESLTQKYDEAINYLLNKNIDKDLIINQSMITPACGAGSLTVEQTKKVYSLTSELARNLKNKYNITQEVSLTN